MIFNPGNHLRLGQWSVRNIIGSVPEELFTRETRFRRRLRFDTYGHYPIHARAIRQWRERSSEV
jgi:hypothetical protein